MTVRELIDKLTTFDENLRVVIVDSSGDNTKRINVQLDQVTYKNRNEILVMIVGY